jgi:AraC family transcriptional activator of pobA
MDLSVKLPLTMGSFSATDVPRYILYGDVGARPDWFVNVEPLDQRCRERGWVIAPHTHPKFTQIMICQGGGGEMSVEGETLTFGAGSVMIVPPHRIHGFRSDAPTGGWVLTIESNYLADLLIRAPALRQVVHEAGVYNFASNVIPILSGDFEALARELREHRDGKAIGAEIHLLSILLKMLRNWPDDGRFQRPVQSSRTELITRFQDVVERRYREQPALPDIARELGVSMSQLRLACRAVAGLSPIGLIHDRLLAEAKRCLAYTTMSIADIAYWLGFSDSAYFSRFFTKASGVPPSIYRRKQDYKSGATQWPEIAA